MAPCSVRRRQLSKHRGGIVSKTIALLSAVFMCALPGSMASLRAQQHPDFTGVYYPINPFGNLRPAGTAPPPAAGTRGAVEAPPRPVLVLDGREGRPDNAPKLTPEYLAKWEVIRKSRMAGSPDYDPNVRCVSGGMPNMMSMTYGMEIQQTTDRITIYGELN